MASALGAFIGIRFFSISQSSLADLLGHSTSEITELYYVRKDTARLSGITEGFEL